MGVFILCALPNVEDEHTRESFILFCVCVCVCIVCDSFFFFPFHSINAMNICSDVRAYAYTCVRIRHFFFIRQSSLYATLHRFPYVCLVNVIR